MGVQVNHYILFGYHLDYKEAESALKSILGSEDAYEEFVDKYSDSAFEEEIPKINGCSMIFDHMDGKSCFFGKVYAKSVDSEYLPTTRLKKPKKEVREKIEKEFIDIFGDSFSNVKPELYLVVNYR